VARSRLKNTSLSIALAIYCVLTLLPFYFLMVRAFTPTVDSTELHLWIPKRPEVNMNARLGNLASINSIDVSAFKAELELTGYLDPRWTLQQIAERKNIDPDRIRDILEPAIRYNGVYTVLNGGYYWSLFGTIVVTVSAVVAGGFLGIMTGTGLAGFRRPWHLAIYNSYLLNMIVPPMMVIIPQYLILAKMLGMQDSYLPIILLHAKGGALSTMVFTSYIATIPRELRESVYMDGGKHYHYFFHVILPLMGTPFAVFASIAMPWFWNDLLHGLLFLRPENYTLPAFVAAIGGSQGRNFEAVYSGVLLSLVPILVVYLVFQKMFIRSAMAGAVKG
jgi:ABC-type glycerol-3-phosphate transport system permease component